jgi:hypothetical protein
MVQRGEIEKLKRMIADYPLVVSRSVGMICAKNKLMGTCLHFSKAKKLIFNGRLGDKKIKREVSYFRMVFCR